MEFTMYPGILRDVTEDEVRTYEVSGVVYLPAILSNAWVARIATGIDDALHRQWQSDGIAKYSVTEAAEALKAAGQQVLSDARAAAIPEERRGRFLTMIGAHAINADIRAAAVESPLPYIAARLFRAKKVNFYDDQTLMKEPGTREYTAFHTDEPYYHLRGDQVCGMWVSPDVVTADSGAMRYVRGSHRWGSYFRTNNFVSQGQGLLVGENGVNNETGQIQLPDIEGNEDKYDIVTYPSNPGDVIVHHSNLIHGSGPNYRADRNRRAVSLRYAGDDVRYRHHRSAPPQPHHRHALRDGDILDSEQFPVVWRLTRPLADEYERREHVSTADPI
jgi:ectoine hydroxylase-related dioxygenase (phytanoyl-CoA dioxygenase family)